MTYRWRMREDGVVMLQETPGALERPPTLSAEMAEGTSKIPGMDRVIANWEALANRIEDAFGIPHGWLLAMIWRESGGNPRAFRREPNGWTGVGLLQITHPALKAGRSDDELCDAETNLLVGASHVTHLIASYGRDFPSISAAFNAGGVRHTDQNPWGMVQTKGHVSAEVAALNYYLLRDQHLAAERAAALQFPTRDLLGEDFDRVTLPDIDELAPRTPRNV